MSMTVGRLMEALSAENPALEVHVVDYSNFRAFRVLAVEDEATAPDGSVVLVLSAREVRSDSR